MVTTCMLSLYTAAIAAVALALAVTTTGIIMELQQELRLLNGLTH